MKQILPEPAPQTYSVVESAAHSLHECRNAAEFRAGFELSTGLSIQSVGDQVARSSAPKAIFLTGSVPLGMATKGSDVDFLVLVDSREALLRQEIPTSTNTDQHLTFSNESDPLRAELRMTVTNGITVETVAAITPSVRQICIRLRRRGPELSDGEIMTLGRLRCGWLLWETAGYLERNQLNLKDPAFDVYCSTRKFAFALIHRQKALRALELADIPQALHLGRCSVELGYLAYFASDGFSYLGTKWLAQLGSARDAAQRAGRHPLLAENLPLLFPTLSSGHGDAALYLTRVAEFLEHMRSLIEQKTLFRIAYAACPQIYRLP